MSGTYLGNSMNIECYKRIGIIMSGGMKTI